MAGHQRTQGRRDLSSGGRSRTSEDTRGHATRTVRDREAPGSNPGPPTSPLTQISPTMALPRGLGALGDHGELTAGTTTGFDPRPCNSSLRRCPGLPEEPSNLAHG